VTVQPVGGLDGDSGHRVRLGRRVRARSKLAHEHTFS
jgi:hypothetical protein